MTDNDVLCSLEEVVACSRLLVLSVSVVVGSGPEL